MSIKMLLYYGWGLQKYWQPSTGMRKRSNEGLLCNVCQNVGYPVIS